MSGANEIDVRRVPTPDRKKQLPVLEIEHNMNKMRALGLAGGGYPIAGKTSSFAHGNGEVGPAFVLPP